MAMSFFYRYCPSPFPTISLSSVQFNRSVMSNSLPTHGLQHARLPCPSPIPSAYSNSCLLSQWCHPTNSSSVVPSPPARNLSQYQGWSFSSVSGLCIRWPKYWSFSFNISPSNEYSDWFPLGLTRLTSLQSKELLRVFSNTTVQKHQFFGAKPSLWSNSHIYTWLP